MATDAEILQKIQHAFGGLEKPAHFTNFGHCEECLAHDELLRSRDRDTLRIEDVGNIGWQPISFCSLEGLAYYMPALARLALAEPTYQYDWYGETLHIHLSSNTQFIDYCNADQRAAVAALFDHLNITRILPELRSLTSDEMHATCARWSA